MGVSVVTLSKGKLDGKVKEHGAGGIILLVRHITSVKPHVQS